MCCHVMNTTLQYEKFMEYDQARFFLHYLLENSLDSVKKTLTPWQFGLFIVVILHVH